MIDPRPICRRCNQRWVPREGQDATVEFCCDDLNALHPIQGIEGYFVTKAGEIHGPRGPRAPYIREGYARMQIRGRHYNVHLLVLETFAGPAPSPEHEGGHGDGNALNNAISNLRWVTREVNEEDKKAVGTAPRGRTRDIYETPPEIVKQVRELRALEAPPSFREIARRLGIHRCTVSRIARGLRRKEVA